MRMTRVGSMAYILFFAFHCAGLHAQVAQGDPPPIGPSRIQSGPINILADPSDFNSISTVTGVPSAYSQFTQAVTDLNGALQDNGINSQFTLNGSDMKDGVLSIDINTGTANSAETISLPAGVSLAGQLTLNINGTFTDPTTGTVSPYFSATGVTAAQPNGYNTVFYLFAIHEMLHALGLGNTNYLTPADIMNGVNSTNNSKNSFGYDGTLKSILTPAVIAQLKKAITQITTPATTASVYDCGYGCTIVTQAAEDPVSLAWTETTVVSTILIDSSGHVIESSVSTTDTTFTPASAMTA